MKYVAYYRVSTAKQGKSGLGLDAQKKMVQDFITGDRRRELFQDYKDVESGKNDHRPQLLAAIDACRTSGATLLIAKLDRLSRNVSFIFTLKDSKVNFQALDVPDANTMTIGIMAVFAQHEREIISQRTKSALAAKRARGFVLGTPDNLTKKARLKGMQVRQANAANDTNNKKASALIKSLRKAGESYKSIADQLNENGYVTRRGKRFQPITVQRLYERFLAIAAIVTVTI